MNSKMNKNYTLVELKALAREKGIEKYSKMNKRDLCQALNLNCENESSTKITKKATIKKSPTRKIVKKTIEPKKKITESLNDSDILSKTLQENAELKNLVIFMMNKFTHVKNIETMKEWHKNDEKLRTTGETYLDDISLSGKDFLDCISEMFNDEPEQYYEDTHTSAQDSFPSLEIFLEFFDKMNEKYNE